ncbi:hypothetical protein RD792_011763 [Penstemon davidsonii]|uniref:NB-ARC domain-containing protein n=1 Tax=Penstemon davidsonii TaxID=160366 RepID=A0ABR0CVH6_9LAMI|nr:hypothetical protein RD792_011763 [Penstemon davidsonii]
MAPTIEFLSKYLIYAKRDGSMELYSSSDEDDEEDIDQTPPLNESKELTLDETEEIDQALSRKEVGLPWNGPTCLAVVWYVMKLDNDVLNNLIKNLDILAHERDELVKKNPEESKHKWEEFISMFVNSFMPKVRKFFIVPKLHEVSDKNNSLKENEILASFMDFLLQILNCEANINLTEEQRYAVLQKELTFLLSLLGDIPFQCTELEEVKNILAEFEILANEAGRFIYSCIFSTFRVKASRFIEEKNSLLKMVEVLNVKIKEHCNKFSELHPFVVSRTYDVIDSIFIVDSLIEDLENLMNNQIHLIINEMKVQIITLYEELTISRSLLKDIRMQQDTVHMDELTESLVKIRNLAYESEYLVNSYVVGNLPIWYLNLRLPVVIPKFELIRTRLQEIKTIYDIKVLDIKKDFSREVPTQAMGTPTTMIIDIVVGFDDEMTKILDDLTGGSEDRQIISIIGMPGLGKTTIARKLYNSRLTLDHFDRNIWCVVSETYQKRKVLIDIWMSLTDKKNKNNFKMDNESLALEIHKSLMGRRYLIVMDDVWCSNVWDDLRRYFPDDGNGSRIVFTSQIRDTTPTNSIVHSLPLLTEDQCWRLLDKKVFPKEACPRQLQGIGKRIAAKCRGLPLAVVVIAGVLANLEKTQSVWEKVETNLDSFMVNDDTNNYSKILELSFKHLPDHLKMCFLYFGAFPEDTPIPVKKLIWLWIAEGFIQREQEKSPELVAEEYLYDLINRSLVLIADRKSDGGIKACSIHDLLRDMCLRKAHEEKIYKSVDDCMSLYEKHHRMFLHSEALVGGRPFGLYHRSFSGHLSHPSSNIPQMKLLKVMNLLPNYDISYRLKRLLMLPNSDSSYELKRVDRLVQLRYLAIDRMPKPLVCNFVNLEFLIIDGGLLNYVPLVILKMVKLRHVKINKYAKFEEDCYICQTTNLRSLSNIFITSDKDNEILRCSPHLHTLKCSNYDGTRFPDLHSLIDLQILNMEYFSYFSGELTNVRFPSTIKKLTLYELGLPWEEMSIIGRLPNLLVLNLQNHAFVGEEWVTRDGEFQELRYLKLLCNDLIKQWITCSEHFPQLQTLFVMGYINLKEIPSEIGDIPTLQKIEVYDSGYEVYKSVVEIEQEQRENGNEELQVINSNERKMEELVRKFQALV